jgi:hypothetical protein
MTLGAIEFFDVWSSTIFYPNYKLHIMSKPNVLIAIPIDTRPKKLFDVFLFKIQK